MYLDTDALTPEAGFPLLDRSDMRPGFLFFSSLAPLWPVYRDVLSVDQH
jgi:hypothetical protein